MRKLEVVKSNNFSIYGFYYEYCNNVLQWFSFASVNKIGNSYSVHSDYFSYYNKDGSCKSYTDEDLAKDVIEKEFIKFIGDVE